MRIFYNNVFKNYFLLTITLLAEEIIFRTVTKLTIFDWTLLRTFIGINIIALICAALFSFFGRIGSNILSVIAALALSIYSVAQAGFKNFIGVFMSFGTSSQVGAVKEYIGDYLNSFHWTYWLILIPAGVLILFYILFDHRIKVLERNDAIDFSDKFDSEERKQLNDKAFAKKKRKRMINSKINAIVVAVLFGVAYYFSLTVAFMQNPLQIEPTRQLFTHPDIPDIAMSQFGPSMYLFVDVKSLLLPSQEMEESTYDKGYVKKEQVISDYTRKIDDTLWEQVANNETKANYKRLNNYFLSQEITDKNDYTGIFKDKNLIVIMMESTNTIVLDERYFPNMHKLYTEGWAWTNNYSPRNSCSTGNNEMSGMVSLFTINNSCTANNYRKNVYPEAIFNLFNNADYTTTSYHNYTEQYYYRSTIHKNMGSSHFYGVEELGIPYSNAYKEWPSDVELVEKMLEKTEDQDRFMVWMTSVTAHQPYTMSSEYGDKHLDLFKDTGYDISLKRYMSKLKEFDNAIGALLDGLEKQGKLNDTVIVLYGDHYPYGLNNKVLNSYFDYDVTKQYEVDRIPFIIYNPEIQAQQFDEYTSYLNITPTVANLFDLDYDPRLYAGYDLLSSTYPDRVVFANGSWKDKKAFYNASTGKITYERDDDTYTVDELKEINKTISEKISMSNLAIKVNYFDYLEKAKEKYRVETAKPEENTNSEEKTE